MPLQEQDDNDRFFDHRREWARTDFEHGGLPRKDWEALLGEMRRRADKAGFLRLALPEEFGGKNIGNLAMAIIREHLAAKGLGLHNDLQNETSVVGNFPQVLMFRDFGTEEQKKTYLPGMLAGKVRIAFRPDRTQAWFGRDMDGDARSERTAMAGASMARRCGTRACMWPRMTWCSAAQRRRRRRARADLPDRADGCAKA